MNEEELSILKQKIEEFSSKTIALTAYQQQKLKLNASEYGARFTLEFLAKKFDLDEKYLMNTFTKAKSLYLDCQLSLLTDVDPNLAGTLDDREIDDIPTNLPVWRRDQDQ
jgi:hypothetical protein